MKTTWNRRRTGIRLGPSIKYGPIDRLFSRYIRQRDRVCQFCQVDDGKRLEAAHIFGRGKKSVRYDPENVYAMHGGPSDRACHHYLDTHDTEKKAWLKARLGEERFAALELRSNTPHKPDLAMLRLWLTKALLDAA